MAVKIKNLVKLTSLFSQYGYGIRSSHLDHFNFLIRCKIGQCGPCLKDKRGTVASAAASSSGKGAKGSKAAATAKSSSAPAAPAKPVDPSRPIGVWLCLRCGLQLCDSNSTANHLAAHWAVPRSGKDSLS